MSEFSELIKNFDNIRDYVRDFFVCGFKERDKFNKKSLRTYDNEKRRVESYLGDYIKYDISKSGKCVFVSLDSSEISANPLYAVYKAKNFTSNDIMLHFYILDALSNETKLTVEGLADTISSQSGIYFETQTVRIKANEYVKNGILKAQKLGKTLYYSLSSNDISNFLKNCDAITDSLKYYQEAVPFGVIGSFLLDGLNKKNDIFKFKHHFIVHTLEDKILLEITNAINDNKRIKISIETLRGPEKIIFYGIPLKIFISSQTGRRYLTTYNEKSKRFMNSRLDYIKSVDILDKADNYNDIKEKLNNNIKYCWGVSFNGYFRAEELSLELYIDEENEDYIIKRIIREGRGGTLKKISKNVFRYHIKLFDANEILPWVKTFTGRIISLKSNNNGIVKKFYSDMERMYAMYSQGEGTN